MASRSSESQSGRMAWLLTCVCVAILAVYDCFGVFFLVHDYDVVHDCQASNRDVHVIWPTNLWFYVLVSVVTATVFTLGLLAVPLGKSFESVEKRLNNKGKKKGRRGMNSEVGFNGQPVVKYGLLMPSLPDWMFLMHGTALIGASLFLGILAFGGYFELFMSRSWCKDKTSAFEELDLWHFARVTFFMQAILGSILFLWGIVWWAMPIWFDLTEPDRLNGGSDYHDYGGARP